MNGTAKADLLLEKLKEDSAEYMVLETREYSLEEKKNAIRSLMNIRMPGELSEELVNLQDKYLQDELKAKGIVRLADIPTIREQFGSRLPHAEKLSLWQGDITRLEVGAIVWNESFLMSFRTVTGIFMRKYSVDLSSNCNFFLL